MRTMKVRTTTAEAWEGRGGREEGEGGGREGMSGSIFRSSTTTTTILPSPPTPPPTTTTTTTTTTSTTTHLKHTTKPTILQIVIQRLKG